MKSAYLVIAFILLLGSAHASSLTVDGKTASQKPDWEAYHSELERAVELQVEATRRETEMRLKSQARAVQRSSPIADIEQSKSDDFRDFPSSLAERSTLHWLSAALKRPIPYESSLRAIFREEGVPEELIYVGLVESGYSRNAVSAAGAVGPWQFIDETGRRYGLKRSKKGDDRRDLMKSTRAAARYLRDLHELLGNWKLALAGYNAGENRVLEAMQKAGTADFWSLRDMLPSETAEYVPRVLAAISIAEKRNPRYLQVHGSLPQFSEYLEAE